jgi:tRNA wybutosine-synthesizing protein 1
MRLIALLTDFGTKDHYVAAMKGVILSINPEARIVDITHEIRKGDVASGAFILLQASRTFPSGTIFVSVVDPGVGTGRKCLTMRTKNDFIFLAPDNGLLSLVAQQYGVEEVREISNPEIMRPEVSATFHGRDILAPAAAWLSLGKELTEVGPKLETYFSLELPTPRLLGRRIFGRVLHLDDFGNAVTNIPSSMIPYAPGQALLLEVAKKRIPLTFARTFGEVGRGEALAYLGSSGFLELAKNLGNFAREMRVEVGMEVRITPVKVSVSQLGRYLKQGYRLVGENSAVKICHWTKESLLGGEGCYKMKFYGISSWRCLQMTPCLFNCTHRCLYCWRMIEATNPEATAEDEPSQIIEEAVQAQRELLSGFKGNPKVDRLRWREAQEPKHAAISLAGEPTLYERLSELIGEFKRRDFTTFLVTNGTLPERLGALREEPTQLYISLSAPDEETYRRVCNPVLENGWGRILESLRLMRGFSCRKVIRLTMVRGLNMTRPEAYSRLILEASPDFVEVKAYMDVGFAKKRLGLQYMPSHEEIRDFAKQISLETGYRYLQESEISRVVLLGK